ncbi:HNH endonuclease [Guptibacillus spartinae]|uniref:phage lytic cycle repressor MrpR family protein n=1 Tax=Guptibacillus spartinae TaxID=3025679 RepID=UPI00235F3AB8|nr:HNH endonuclease [Pseudalkalibacillus spartinae]
MRKTKDIPENYYQYKLKVEFFNKYIPSTQHDVKTLFRHMAEYEKKFRKDLHSFTDDELKVFLVSRKAESVRSLDNTLSTINKYINFCCEKGYVKREDNPVKSFNYKEAKMQLLNSNTSEYALFTAGEIMNIAMGADNAQDGVVLALLFEGLNNKKTFQELINLKYKDVDFDRNEIHLTDRTITITPKTAKLITNAYTQDEYLSVNGDKVRRYKMEKAGFILKGIRGEKQVKPERISQAIIRLAKIAGIKNLRATNVVYSGQNHYAKSLLREKGVMKGFTRNDLRETASRTLRYFGIPVNSNAENNFLLRLENDLDDIKPEKQTAIIDRLKRDKMLVKDLKKVYHNQCQVCDTNLTGIDELAYSEVHHIRPYNEAHNGSDEINNCLVLCPNHHKLFDLGILAINPRDFKSLIHIDEENSLNGKVVEFKHEVDKDNIRYNYKEIFLKRKIQVTN